MLMQQKSNLKTLIVSYISNLIFYIGFNIQIFLQFVYFKNITNVSYYDSWNYRVNNLRRENLKYFDIKNARHLETAFLHTNTSIAYCFNGIQMCLFSPLQLCLLSSYSITMMMYLSLSELFILPIVMLHLLSSININAF